MVLIHRDWNCIGHWHDHLFAFCKELAGYKRLSTKENLGLRFQQLFKALAACHYEWAPLTPDRLLVARKSPQALRPLVQFFGIAIECEQEALTNDGLSTELLTTLVATGLAEKTAATTYQPRIAISGSPDQYVVHSPWPPVKGDEHNYVHCAQESFTLARLCNRDLEGFIGKNILDLGCSSGVLSFEVAGVANQVLGFDICQKSIEWARATASAYGFANARFETSGIGTPEAKNIASKTQWDWVLFNPPMVVPSKDVVYPHRDGGAFGIELPLLFLDFAAAHLKKGGEVRCFITNPIVHGKGLFFEKFVRSNWQILDERCVNDHFNQTIARKEGYADKGIQRIELWLLHLKRV